MAEYTTIGKLATEWDVRLFEALPIYSYSSNQGLTSATNTAFSNSG
jgi:hypothetical protein